MVICAAVALAPRVTVLLPVRDGEAYLREAIDSILRQTWRDFELVVLRRHDRNAGLIPTLSEGLEHARGRYLARINADDIAHRRRLERQVR
jgi:glycosyltransferase involved in cell wall biosynthesis